MSKPHKHAEVIKAWAEGKEIEVETTIGWQHIGASPSWSEFNKYRVKPEEPAKQEAGYPLTSAPFQHLCEVMDNKIFETMGGKLIAVANAAIRHGIDNGYLITPEQANANALEHYQRGLAVTKAQLDEAWNRGCDEALAHSKLTKTGYDKAVNALEAAGFIRSQEGEWIAPPKDEVSQAPGYNILRDIAVADAIRRATMNGIVLTDARLMTIIAGLP